MNEVRGGGIRRGELRRRERNLNRRKTARMKRIKRKGGEGEEGEEGEEG